MKLFIRTIGIARANTNLGMVNLASHGQFRVKGLNSAAHEQNSSTVSASKV